MSNKILLTDKIIRSSFFTSYALLFTTGTITFIESLRTDDIKIRHIMNVETCISLIAGYFYSNFINMIKDKEIEYEELMTVRYTDWFISTPFMILALELVLTYNLKTPLKLIQIIIPLLLNFGMLLSGYLGERKKIDKMIGGIVGFIFFGLMYYYIYHQFLRNKNNKQNLVVFLVFLIVWSLYGVAYYFNCKTKNIMYNILDVIAKAFVGIGFWAYLSGVFR